MSIVDQKHDRKTGKGRARTRAVAAVMTAFSAVAALAVMIQATPAAAASGAGAGGGAKGNTKAVCGPAKPGHARCFAHLRTDVNGGTGVRGPASGGPGKAALALPQGFGPADLRAAYKLPATGGTGQTVAIVDAGDDPTAEADLAVYRTTYGLPACTTANGCFKKVDGTNPANPLPPDQGWGVEIALDLDMVSASCPACHILLVEGDSATFTDLANAEDTAVALGAKEVSNSYGGQEQNGLQQIEPAYSHAGVAIVASSGDYGYGIANMPAVFANTIAVGGTSLTKASNARGWSEQAWGGAGSGCSAWVAKPSWQHDPNCPGRMVADVSADADPNTGPAVYGTTDGLTGWNIVGGTSASSPYIAGVIALAGNPSTLPNASRLYAHTTSLFDVVGGNNAGSMDCGGDYQCNAVAGYDGPTGLGTPNGIGAF